MTGMTRILFFTTVSIFSASASAAIFDSIESVETLKIIAEQKTEKTDRMPAGKESTPTKEENEKKEN